MKKAYGDHRQSSGVTHYTVMPDGIAVHFGDRVYRYTHDSAGREAVDTMKRLAASGAGLASYIRANRPPHE